MPADTWDSPLIAFLEEEIAKAGLATAVLDRLLDLLLIAVLRAWFNPTRGRSPRLVPSPRRPGRRTGPAHAPQQPVPPLDGRRPRCAGRVSRAALARRFPDVVGEPPMTFLTGWRLALAADLLGEPGSTVGSVARQVGYGSPYALSAAFKRVRGVSPDEHRRAALTARSEAAPGPAG